MTLLKALQDLVVYLLLAFAAWVQSLKTNPPWFKFCVACGESMNLPECGRCGQVYKREGDAVTTVLSIGTDGAPAWN